MSSLQAAYSQHRPCGALVPAEAGPNFAAWWAGVHVCEQLRRGFLNYATYATQRAVAWQG